MSDTKNYEDLENKELKKLCKRRNLAVGGNKAVLITRLEQDDKNAAAGKDNPEPPEDDEEDSEEDSEEESDDDSEEDSEDDGDSDEDSEDSEDSDEGEDDEDEEEGKPDTTPETSSKKKKRKGKINPASSPIVDVMTLIDNLYVKCEQPSPGGDSANMLRQLAAQKKVRTIIALDTKEQRGIAFDTVILNGFRLNIMKGFFVEVPEQIADVIQEAYYETENAIENIQIVNPITGEKSYAALDKKSLEAIETLDR